MSFQIGSEDWWRLRRLKLSGVPEAITNPGNLKIIETTDKIEKKSFFEFVKKRYVKLGIVPPDWAPPPLPGRFFAAYLKDLAGPACVALLVDKRLPCEGPYKKELKKIKGWRNKIAEITLVATQPSLKARNAIFYVFRRIYYFSLKNGITDLVVCINPKYADFYEKILLFERKGPRMPHPFLPNLGVVLEHLNLKKAEKKYYEVYKNFPEPFNLYQFFAA
ncbi:N-acyl amino acid synthase FeeM domain-containing protein [Thermodesulfatator atlanticus]|uniref:N-acyl amino acid synthase FeeM domain-containing protein n=1 Tax=Thermodesulfatator atlanticus TaxID=501497 RepID=UPI0003B549C3|nr:hypothetical protein [Thermodesulfatator atlanticus]